MVYKGDEFTQEEIYQISACEKAHFSDAGSAESLQTMLQDRVAAVAAFIEDKLCGFGYIYIAPGEAELLRIAVNEEYRGLGIARGILSRLHQKASENLCEKMFLEVRRSNSDAIRLYEAAGYTQIGVRKGFYRDPKEDALLYSADLTQK